MPISYKMERQNKQSPLKFLIIRNFNIKKYNLGGRALFTSELNDAVRIHIAGFSFATHIQ